VGRGTPRSPNDGPSAAARRDPGGLERDVVAALAAAGAALTANDVLAELGGTLAYTTVMTTLARLYDKRVLDRQRAGRAYAYRLAEPPESINEALAARQMRRLLDRGGDRAGVLTRFVADLDPADERLLAELLTGGSTEPETAGDGSPQPPTASRHQDADQ
jgi:predicted transcriptional regulator